MSDKRLIPEKRPQGTWVQTDRSAHEEWAKFLKLKGAIAAMRVMHQLLARMGDHNAAVISQKALADLLEYDVRTIRRAVAMLKEHNWVEVMQIGDRGGINAYVINSRVAWQGKRDGIRNALFSANVYVTEKEQPDRIKEGEPLKQVPDLFPGESQLPSGPGLPPISEPSFPGMEPDLPARLRMPEDDTE